MFLVYGVHLILTLAFIVNTIGIMSHEGRKALIRPAIPETLIRQRYQTEGWAYGLANILTLLSKGPNIAVKLKEMLDKQWEILNQATQESQGTIDDVVTAQIGMISAYLGILAELDQNPLEQVVAKLPQKASCAAGKFHGLIVGFNERTAGEAIIPEEEIITSVNKEWQNMGVPQPVNIESFKQGYNVGLTEVRQTLLVS